MYIVKPPTRSFRAIFHPGEEHLSVTPIKEARNYMDVEEMSTVL